MSVKHSFLVEIHTEELPPKSLRTLAEHFCNGIRTRLEKNELAFTDAVYYAAPRRLAVLVNELHAQQNDKAVERKGPALDKAYDANGKPSPACVGFAKSCNIDVSELVTLETPQGKFVGCKQQVRGKSVAELLPPMIEEALATLPVAKPMRWGNNTQKFIRPIHNVLMLYGNDVIDATILGLKTNRKTRGHRFLADNKWLEISNPESYLATLKNAFVIADFAERKKIITTTTHELVKKELGDKGHALIDEALLDEVTSIVEYPQAVCGSFDKAFLDVPQEALISSMQDHQRYFPIVDQQQKLLPYFITISNIQSKNPQSVIAGNERVLRARLSDAAFFYETDKKSRLEDRIAKLKTIIFQNKLGTLFDKTERIQKLATLIATQINENPEHATRAALLMKTDLTTDLVGEFPELQGIAGYYYALNDKEPESIAQALGEQYMPRFSGDQLPTSKLGCILALADRLDTLVGVFGINQAPTSDKDPFGLRRAALGILRILIEKPLSLDIKTLISAAHANYTQKLENPNTIQDALNFILERLKPWYQEQGVNTNVIASVMSLNLTVPYDIHRRIQAVIAFKNLSEAESLSVANKRVSNILAKYDGDIGHHKINAELFETDAERELAKQLDTLGVKIHTLSQNSQYEEVLTQLAALRTPVDNFFDNVMVMTEDQKRRENRILMLRQLRELFLNVADVALLQ